MEALEHVGLKGMGRKYPAEISGGMKKRVALARALVTEPSIVLFDEPTTGLDPIIANSIHRLIIDSHKKYDFTGVISHEIPEIFEVADRVAMLHDGIIIQVGTPDEIKDSSNDIVLRTKELYYGLLLAKDMKNLVLEIKDELVRSIEKVEKQLQIGSPWADEVDLYKLRAFLGETDKSLNEAEKGIALAKDALMTSIGLPGGTEFDVADSTLSPDERLPDDVGKYIMEAVEFRPEFIQLKEGLIARKALVDVEKSNYYPQLFLGFRGSIAGTSNRDRIENPFIFDYFNHSYGAVFIGVKWAVDFGITKGKVREAEAEHNKLLEKKRFADEGIPFQVRKVYLEIEEAKKNIAATEEACKNARKWLIAAVANFDLGIGEAKEVADAAVAYAQMKANHLRSIYNQKLSFANLLYATGTDLKEIK